MTGLRVLILAAGVVMLFWGTRRAVVEGFKTAPDNRRAAQGCPVMIFGLITLLAGILG